MNGGDDILSVSNAPPLPSYFPLLPSLQCRFVVEQLCAAKKGTVRYAAGCR
jgi:hypothetical protein